MKPHVRQLMVGQLLALAGLSIVLLDQAPALDIGDQAPELSTVTWLNAEPPADLKGQWVIVDFWATWCPPCVESIPQLATLDQTHPQLTVLGIADQSAETVQTFIDNFPTAISYPMGIADAAMLPQWTAQMASVPLPYAFLIAPDGEIAWHGNPLEIEPVINQALAGTLDAESIALMRVLESDLEVAIDNRLLSEVDRLSRAILAIAPRHREALLYASMVARHQQDAQRFRDLFATIDPLSIPAAQALDTAHWLINQPDLNYRHPDLALALAIEAVRQLPNDADAHAIHAQALATVGNLSAAIRSQQQAISLASDQQRVRLAADLGYLQALAELAESGLPIPPKR